MSLYSQYELLNLMRDGASKIFHAKRIATGETVAVHLLTGTQASELERLFSRLGSLPDPHRGQVVDSGIHEGTGYVVTRNWQQPESLSEWAANVSAPAERFTKAGNWRVPAAEFEKKSAPKPGADLPATQLMSTPPFPTPNDPPEPAHPRPEPPPPPLPTAASEDFDKLFGSAQRPASPPPLSPAKEPGDFTRIFQIPVAPPKPPSQPSASGKFTKHFQTPAAPTKPTAHPAFQQPFGNPQAQPQATNAPGEFTRMFGIPNVAAPSPQTAAPAVPSPADGEYARLFAIPSASPQGLRPQPLPVATARSVDPRSQAKPNYFPLFIVLGVLFVLAVALILLFALRK